VHTKEKIVNLLNQLVESTLYRDIQVHCITNFVTAKLCANAVLTTNASPIMADAPEEVPFITSGADALMLNLGTLSQSRKDAMLLAMATATAMPIPIVIDPVGIGASHFRKNTFEQLIATGRPSVIKGNISEIASLANNAYSHPMIDSDKTLDTLSISEKCQISISVATRYQCIVVITGNPDIISDGHMTILLHNGHPMLKRITGTGCMLSALIASYCAHLPDKCYYATVLATATMGYCGEIAAEKSVGTGTFEIELLNALSTLVYTLFEKGLRYDYYTK